MAKWFQISPEQLIYQPDQQAFLQAIRLRNCRTCGKEFEAAPPLGHCPTCAVKGSRRFDHLTIIAGRRWGKSLVGSIAGASEACINGTIGWACAPSNPKLHRYVIPAFQRLIPPEFVDNWNSEFKDLKLKNGSLIHFQTLEDPDQGRGQGLDWLWIDEVCELSKDHWDVISPSLDDRGGVAFFTTSPRSYDWVYHQLFKPAEDGLPGFWGCHAKTKDNPKFQTQEGMERLAARKATMSDAMYRQEFEADFVDFKGSVYGGLVDSQVLRSEESIKGLLPEWPDIAPWRQVLVGIDTGADHPFGAIKVIATEIGLVVVGEYLERNKAFIQHASNIKTLAFTHNGIKNTTNVKWAINKNEKQPSLELAQHGIYCQRAENEIVAGTERVKSWLQTRQLWFIEDKCPKTIQQMKAYRWDDNTTTDGQLTKQKVFKIADELPDCLRYALMTWPQLPSTPVEEEKPRDLSSFSPEIRVSIERMRRIDNKEKLKPNDVVMDFYGN